MSQLIVVGLGPSDGRYLSAEVVDLLNTSPHVVFRTTKHPAAGDWPRVASFDEIYRTESSVEDVYEAMVSALVAEAEAKGSVVYAVPGSPFVAERTVELLRERYRGDLEIRPSMSFLDLVWSAAEIDPVSQQVTLLNGHDFAREAAGKRGALLVSQCDSREVLSAVKLSYEVDTPEKALILHHLGLEDAQAEWVAWSDLDRHIQPDHLTSVFIPASDAIVGQELVRLHELSRTLRERCPWDAEQTHSSLAQHLIEETYECYDAIQALESASEGEAEGAAEEDLIEELGDVLFQVFAHTAIAEEEGRFDIAVVAEAVTNKLIARHTHVFGADVAETASDVERVWMQNKAEEKQRASVLDGVAWSLPALALADKVLSRTEKAGKEYVPPRHSDTLTLGERLLGLVYGARKTGENAEESLRRMVMMYAEEFQAEEALRRDRDRNGHAP